MFRIIEGNCLIEWILLIKFCIHCLIMIYCTRMENDLAQIYDATNKISSFTILGSINPPSPSADKKRMQRLKKSPEAKEAQKEKNQFAMQKRRELETKEQKALTKTKLREKQRLIKKKKWQAETDEQIELQRENDRFETKRKRQSEIEEETKIAQGKCKTQDEEELFR